MDELHGDRGSLAAQLRLLRSRRGLTLSGLAKRTSYSRSSWERYLNGKALPPQTALTEFASAVGVPAAPLLVLREQEQDHHRKTEVRNPPPQASSAAPGPPGDAASADGPGREEEAAPGSRASGDAQERPIARDLGATGQNGRDTVIGGSERASPPARSSRARLTLVSTASACTALVAGILIGGWIFGGNDAEGQNRESAHGDPRCLEFECRDKDSERMGCHIGAWTAAATWSGRSYIELRYSPRCRAAWARITDAHVDDTARVEGPRGVRNERSVTYENDTYSPMVEAPYPAAARACGVIKGKETCTSAGGPSPMPPALTDEREPARKPAPTKSG